MKDRKYYTNIKQMNIDFKVAIKNGVTSKQIIKTDEGLIFLKGAFPTLIAMPQYWKEKVKENERLPEYILKLWPHVIKIEVGAFKDVLVEWVKLTYT